jgi:hypothetical protein
MAVISVDFNLGIYTSYFHAIELGDDRNIFNKNGGSIMLNTAFGYVDVTDRFINPFLANTVLRQDGDDYLIQMQGQLAVPDTPPADKWPLVMLLHGQHPPIDKGKQVPSYTGYKELQEYLAARGIASYSVDLFYANLLQSNANPLQSNKTIAFNKSTLDNNQRIQLFFLHLKLLKIMAGETVDEPSVGALSIRYYDGTKLVNLRDAITNSSANVNVMSVNNQLSGKIDFSNLGIMGHSRGADTVSRIPAYFYKGNTPNAPSFPVHTEVDKRNKNLAVQLGKPSQDNIKSILALEPTATVNEDEPTKTGFIIDGNQTIYFLGVGTADEDVTLDAVRLYEYPTCSKVMIAINGASHKRFNTIWANDGLRDEFDGDSDPPHLMDKPTHTLILKFVFGPCFTSTLTGNSDDLKYFTKENTYPIELTGKVDIQAAWKFGFPLLQTDGKSLDDINTTAVAGLTTQQLSNPPFKQTINAFYIEKDDAATDTVKISVTPGSTEDLSKYSHFSFRFAKAFDLRADEERPILKNFSFQAFAGNNPVGKPIAGTDLDKLQLKALDAYHRDGGSRSLGYFVLLQTAEIALNRFSQTDLATITRIEINIAAEPKGLTPTAHIVGWSLGATALGFVIGGGAMILKHGDFDMDKIKKDKTDILLAAGAGALILGGLTLLYELKPFKNGFAFDDFLLTNRVIATTTNP